MGQRPRWFKPDTVYEQTQRTVDRQFLFAPIPGVRNAIGASAARALQKHPVKLYWLEVNHEHLGSGAISGSKEHLENLVHFKRTYHRLLAEEINRLHGRSGAIFSSPARTTEFLDNESSEAQMFYAILNPVKGPTGTVFSSSSISHFSGTEAERIEILFTLQVMVRVASSMCLKWHVGIRAVLFECIRGEACLAPTNFRRPPPAISDNCCDSTFHELECLNIALPVAPFARHTIA